MNVLCFVLAGVLGGALGGMGFGGGTLLIPILTLVFELPPKTAAWLNLIAFLPAASVAMIVHSKDRSILWKEVFFLLLFAFVGVILAFALGDRLSDRLLKGFFGWFLILFGAFSLFRVLFGFCKRKE